ncbi:hypothetical protein XSR1_30051 [Xenorhabdus szentirmaii DSM 16338]|uniref:Uncharacterized protein n=1 Tax=Xenorhabdus szentirmaii DSM 16338 TaxID=1427518 RepID=W1J150_9GAMM|nr:hypothetical protein XSR1_30051 [Xenorhabdus szentirmaii DSM 16338]
MTFYYCLSEKAGINKEISNPPHPIKTGIIKMKICDGSIPYRYCTRMWGEIC